MSNDVSRLMQAIAAADPETDVRRVALERLARAGGAPKPEEPRDLVPDQARQISRPQFAVRSLVAALVESSKGAVDPAHLAQSSDTAIERQEIVLEEASRPKKS